MSSLNACQRRVIEFLRSIGMNDPQRHIMRSKLLLHFEKVILVSAPNRLVNQTNSYATALYCIYLLKAGNEMISSVKLLNAYIAVEEEWRIDLDDVEAMISFSIAAHVKT